MEQADYISQAEVTIDWKSGFRHAVEIEGYRFGLKNYDTSGFQKTFDPKFRSLTKTD